MVGGLDVADYDSGAGDFVEGGDGGVNDVDSAGRELRALEAREVAGVEDGRGHGR